MIKRALVYAYGNIDHDNTFRAAAHFASQHNCALTAVFVTPDYMNLVSIYGPGPVNLAKHYYDMQKDFGLAAQKRFTHIADDIGCNAQWHTLSELEAQNNPSMYTDIIFVSQPNIEPSVIFNDTDFVDSLIVDTGIPVIVIPQNWTQERLGTQPLLGWKESREAVCAVRHSLPLMRDAKQVNIVSVVEKFNNDEDLIRGVEISAFLSNHDVACDFQCVATASEDRNEASTLQRFALVNNSDLIIIGGYGHSRLREIILGGVTKDLIRSSKVPVLLAH